MGAERKTPIRQVNQRNTYYIEGNNARKLMAAPQREREEAPLRERKPAARRREKTAKAIQVNRGVDFLTMMFLAAVMAVTVFACFRYLELQSGNKQLDKELLARQGQLEKLMDKNNAAAAEFDKLIDFDMIKNKAVGEYGMVFPNENQIIYYEEKIHEYMRQNEIITDLKLSTLLDTIFNSQGQ